MPPSKHAEEEMEVKIVGDTKGIHDCLANLYPKDGEAGSSSSSSTSIAVDLAGNEGREGSVSTMQLYAANRKTVWIFDITALGEKAFDEKSESGHSLRNMLEDKNVKKIFYDVRNDSDALYSHFNICLQGVFDLQILDLVDRHISSEPTRWLNPLEDATDKYQIPISDWNGVKLTGNELFSFERFSGRMFNTRPWSPRVLACCAQSVVRLPDLETAILRSIGAKSLARDAHKKFVEEVSAKRVTDSQRKEYNPYVVLRTPTLSRVTFNNNPGF